MPNRFVSSVCTQTHRLSLLKGESRVRVSSVVGLLLTNPVTSILSPSIRGEADKVNPPFFVV
jgi:hypothetical protein